MIETLNIYGDFWIDYFGLAVLQNTFFLGIIFFTLNLLRHASAFMKYTICIVGLIKLLMPPFVPIGNILGIPYTISIFNTKHISSIQAYVIISISCHIIRCKVKQWEGVLSFSILEVRICFSTQVLLDLLVISPLC